MAPDDETAPGCKSAGLFLLREGWTVPFAVLSSGLHQLFIASGSGTRLQNLISPEIANELLLKLASFGDSPEDISLLVRSDAADESLAERGQLSSHRSDASLEGVLDAAEQIFKEATHQHRQIGLILQNDIGAQMSGHLSNERRISRSSRNWLCEMVNGPAERSRETPIQKMLRVETVNAAPPGPLLCSNRAEIYANLRRVGKFFHDQRERRHLEWIWDGERLWIVQNDPDEVTSGQSPYTKTTSTEAEVDSSTLSIFRKFDPRSQTPWQKLQCVSRFAEVGMPLTNLYFATALNIAENIHGLIPSDMLRKDLATLLVQPLVIRTDVRNETAFLLARTDTVRDPDAAMAFFGKVLTEANSKQRSLNDVCFIVHLFIPAAVSAFSFATPGNRRVRVDAMWGLPDGLEFCAHDSYELDSATRKIIEKRIRYKPTFLANLSTGEWKVESLALPFRWRESLSVAELREISSNSQALAEKEGRPVVIMWFAKIPGGLGHPDLLPWRLTCEDAPREVAAASASHFFGSPIEISNSGDLANLRLRVDNISSIILCPDGPHLRNELFLKALATIAVNLKTRIDLQGSFLSHAYYVLRKAGAHVACIDPIDPPPMKRRFQKLVRDRIPVKIERNGEIAETTTLTKIDLLEVLRTKLVEESLEVLHAAEDHLLREEMADVYEVLRAMCHGLGCSITDVEEDADNKRKALGGFQEGIVLIETKDTPLFVVDEQERQMLFSSSASASEGKRIETQKSISVAGRKAKSQIDRMILPLVPPVPSKYRGSIRIEIRQLNAQFRIVYGEKSVEIILDKNGTPSPRGQLRLPLK